MRNFEGLQALYSGLSVFLSFCLTPFEEILFFWGVASALFIYQLVAEIFFCFLLFFYKIALQFAKVAAHDRNFQLILLFLLIEDY